MSKVKILVVEDEEVSRGILNLALEGRDTELQFVGDGESAVEKAGEFMPDLIVMDIMLPRMNGFEATKAIRRIEGLEGVPILALTARTMKFDEDQALEAGCSAYATKPFRIADLRAKIAELLDE